MVALVALVVALNVALNVALPALDIDLPSIGTPDIPGWVKSALHVKNWILLGIVVVFILIAGLGALDQGRKGDRPEGGEA